MTKSNLCICQDNAQVTPMSSDPTEHNVKWLQVSDSKNDYLISLLVSLPLPDCTASATPITPTLAWMLFLLFSFNSYLIFSNVGFFPHNVAKNKVTENSQGLHFIDSTTQRKIRPTTSWVKVLNQKCTDVLAQLGWQPIPEPITVIWELSTLP